ncbi:MAG TPA: TonB C-terminal domain-containing protein [Terriglobales bacterium]|nr:TonB C-terminal domain-containing protein [Terriglobales bacterium]
MPVTQIPPRDPLTPLAEQPEQRDLFEAQHWETAYRGFNPDDVPHLLIQLQDDLSRARKREALWLSVILHLFVIILLWNSEKLMMLLPHKTVNLAIRTDTDRSKDATFLELPPDAQKLTRGPDAKVISDKDRIASSKTPQINREDLKKILQSAHPGRPGANVQAPPAQGQPAQNQAAQNQQPPVPQENQQQASPQPRPSDQTAQLQTPPQASRPQPNFNTSMTAGSAIEQAARAAAETRGNYGSGQAGDYGLSQGRSGAKALDQAEILTDTMGVDFGPYLTRITQIVRQNWYNLMPPSVYPPILKQGKLSIEFVILKDGKTTGMVVHTPSGDVALDRAAWGSITASTPFPPLPKEFPGQILGLRFYYFYNLEVSRDLK